MHLFADSTLEQFNKRFGLRKIGAITVQSEESAQASHFGKRLRRNRSTRTNVDLDLKEPTEVWNTPSAIYVLTQEDIRRSGVSSVADALRLVPGVNVARVNGSRNWAVAIRGLGDQFSRYVLVLIDGRSVYTPRFGGVFWTIHNVMIKDVDRIEVIRGSGGTIWGTDAVNGIINIITKASSETQGVLASAGGGSVDHDTESLRYGGRNHHFDFRVFAFGFLRGAQYHQNGQPISVCRTGSSSPSIGFIRRASFRDLESASQPSRESSRVTTERYGPKVRLEREPHFISSSVLRNCEGQPSQDTFTACHRRRSGFEARQ